MLEIDQKIISWAQYLQWSNINYERYICDDNNTLSEEIAKAFQWFASEYVVIEGWKELKENNIKIDSIIEKNTSAIDLLRRARNAIFHYQSSPLDKRLINFTTEKNSISTLINLHEEFLGFLLNYPNTIYPYNERKEEFVKKFYEIIDWKPCIIKNT